MRCRPVKDSAILNRRTRTGSPACTGQRSRFPSWHFDRLFPVLASSREVPSLQRWSFLFQDTLEYRLTPTPGGFSVLLFFIHGNHNYRGKRLCSQGRIPCSTCRDHPRTTRPPPPRRHPSGGIFFFVVLLFSSAAAQHSRCRAICGALEPSRPGCHRYSARLLAYARISEQFAVAIKPFHLNRSAQPFSARIYYLLGAFLYLSTLFIFFFGEYARSRIMIACAIAGFIVLWKMQAYRLTAITCAWTAIILIGAYGLLSGLLSFPSSQHMNKTSSAIDCSLLPTWHFSLLSLWHLQKSQ